MATDDERKRELEIKKLEEEISKIQLEKGKIAKENSWHWPVYKNVKATEWALAITTAGILITGLVTGYFSTAKERLAIEKIDLENKKEQLKKEIDTIKSDINTYQNQLAVYRAEDAGLEEIKRSRDYGVLSKVSTDYLNEDTQIQFAPAGTTPKTLTKSFRNPSLLKAIQAACSVRAIRRIEINGFVLDKNDMLALCSKTNLRLLIFNRCEFIEDSISSAIWPKELKFLGFTNMHLDSISRVPRSENVSVLYWIRLTIGDEKITGLHHQLPNTTKIFADSSFLSDKCVDELLKLQKLVLVDAEHTKLTAAGVLKLMRHEKINTILVNRNEITADVQAEAKRTMRILVDSNHSETSLPVPIFNTDSW